MPLLRAFLSFDFDHDLTAKTLFAGQARSDSPTPFAVADWSSKEVLPQSTWEDTIRRKIGSCHMLIVLVGRHMRSATGVHKEIAMADALAVPRFGVYVNGAGVFDALPPGLFPNQVVPWEWRSIAQMVFLCSQAARNQ